MRTLLATAAPRTRRELPLVAALDAALPLEEVGGKAWNLARARALGLRTPESFVILAGALESHLQEIGLLDSIAGAVTPDRGAEISARIKASTLGPPLRELVASFAAPWMARGPVVVRSSAVGEDSQGASFAGQLDSFLHVSDGEALERAILDCWASCWSERSLSYAARRGLPPRGMGVLVQPQVDPEAAGVMFTRASDDSIVIEYGAGLPDGLVSGAVDPGRIAMSRDGARWRRLAGGDVEARAMEELMSAGATRARFAEIASALEAGLGGPQDVEWAIDRSRELFVLQSRPITAPLAIAAERAGEAPVRWSNANIGENFPDPVCPLLYSLAAEGYAHYFRNLAVAFGFSRPRLRRMDDPLRHIVGVHGGRLYYNLTSIHAVLRAAPCGDALVAAFNRFVGASDVTPPGPIHRVGRAAEWAELVRIALATAWSYRSLGARIQRFEETIDRFAATTTADRLERASLRELRLALAGLMDIRCHRWTDAALADAASMVGYATLGRAIERGYGGSAPEGITNSLLKAIPGLRSAEPVHRLWELSRMLRGDARLARAFEREDAETLAAIRSDPELATFRQAFERYLLDWGFRCSAELMLTAPSVAEDPAQALASLRAYARLDSEGPEAKLARELADCERTTEAVLSDLSRIRVPRWPFLRYGRVVRVLLRSTRAAIGFRERARTKQALLYSRCRAIALALGDRLAESGLLRARDDVFWLTVGELDELAAGGAMFPHDVAELVDLRREAHARLAAMDPPDSFVLAEGDYLRGTATPRAESEPEGESLNGSGASTGIARGRAVLMADAKEAGRLAGGEILVARQTDPGWTPVFFLVRGLVVERGGMLSHGAIVAREFGIPCVVGVRGATARIADGVEVTVDGNRGSVHVHG